MNGYTWFLRPRAFPNKPWLAVSVYADYVLT